MKKRIQILATLCLVSACASPIAENKPTEVKPLATTDSASNQPENASEASAFPSDFNFSESLDSLDDEISGTSSSGAFDLTTTQVNPKWSFGSYFFGPTNGTKTYNLTYSRRSGDYVFAHVWYYHASNRRFETLSPGWHYDKSDLNNYSSTITLPDTASHIYVGFFSSGGGVVNAQLTAGASTSTNSNDLQTKFKTAQNRAGSALGNPRGSVVRASTANAYKQDFDNGIILLKDGASEAYYLYGDIYKKWAETGNTSRYGLPVSNSQSGRVINGKPSQYQLFDKQPGDPSLHSWSGGTYLFLSGIRSIWNQGDNANKLGHPTSDEVNGSQSFENGSIDWNNGSPRINTGSSNSSNNCFFYPVGNPPGSYLGYKNEQGFQKYYFRDGNRNYGYHLGDDLNGKGGGDTDLGDPVYSIGTGEVTSTVSGKPGWGNIVFIKHSFQGKDMTSMYAHLDKIFVSKGQQISALQQIGTIGKGDNNRYLAHLHLELREGASVSSGIAYTQTKVSRGPESQIDAENFIKNNRCQ